jgi:cytochrome c oxidase subunit 2
MPFLSRLRRPGTRKAGQVALTVAVAALLAACGGNHPDSIFHQRTDFNRDVDYLFRILIWAGTGVFIFVEAILIWTLFKFRSRPGQPAPEHVHGNTTLEIAWTVIPLIILVVIGIPTVRTILRTQAVARSDALQVEVIGHQWWWEFRYPQYTAPGAGGHVDTVVTANELYLPIGKTVNFTLHTKDVIHSFWVPALAGKRDLIANHTNFLWYTPDSVGSDAFNGACVEYCGASHANMRFKTFTVTQADFDSWVAHQLTPAVGTAAPAAPATAAVDTSKKAPGVKAAAATTAAVAPVTPPPAVVQAGYTEYPRDKIPAYAIPQTPYPEGLTFDDALLAKGDPANGMKLAGGAGGCLACHSIRGNPMMVGNLGPNLTHLATRSTIAGGLFPNDPAHLARWIKNARAMKPGVIMNTIGLGQFDPVLKTTMKAGLTDPQIADVVAYLNTLK